MSYLEVRFDPSLQLGDADGLVQSNKPSLGTFSLPRGRMKLLPNEWFDDPILRIGQQTLRKPVVDTAPHGIKRGVGTIHRDPFRGASQKRLLKRVRQRQGLEAFEDGWVVCNNHRCLFRDRFRENRRRQAVISIKENAISRAALEGRRKPDAHSIVNNTRFLPGRWVGDSIRARSRNVFLNHIERP